ncbi:MAG TPA: DUF6766 family protein [Acidobacteriaceae bacterium]|nr:DUF6766 family protein [Acidobacteriaceae bacterium]
MKRSLEFLHDHGLLLIFIFLFVAFLIGQAIAGSLAFNETRAAHGLVSVGYWSYIKTGNFLQGVFANWQAAILQLGSLIIFSVFLRARGAAHSIDPKKRGHAGRSSTHSKKTASGWRAGWVYRNSLSLAFVALFLVTFVLHLYSGAAAYNEQRALTHQAPLTVAAFSVSSKFWFSTLQTWEAEYMAIALYIFLTIFLRQEGSPESKRVDAKDTDTGKTNE